MRILALLIILSAFTVAPAHSLEHHSISVGAGINLNNPDLQVDSDADDTISLTPALAVRELLKINEQLFFRTGLWLQQKSARFEIFDSFYNDVAYTTIYASVPLTAQYQIKNNIAVFGGYIADVRINDYCDGSGVFENSCEILEESKSVVHLATLGGSLAVNKRVDLNVSYQHGLSDVVSDGFKLNTLAVMFMYKFN